MTNNSTPLVPTSIVDKNGRQTTVHKKLMSDNGAGNGSLPSPVAPASSRAKIDDWSRISTAEAIAQARLIAPTLNDPTHLWDNFEFYTGMLNSHHHVEARAMFDKYNVLSSLRDSWLDMHGMELMVDRDKYYNIKGPNGYKAFDKARDALLEASVRPDPSKNASPKHGSATADTASWAGLNPFNALRGRKERKDLELKQQLNVKLAMDRAFSSVEQSDRVTGKLKNPEMLAKASEMVDLLEQMGADDDDYRNFGRGLGLDDDNHSILKSLHAHKDYVALKPEHIGLMVEMSRYLKDKGLDYQQEDGTMPNLEGYVEAFAREAKQHLLLTGESEADLDTKRFIERAIRNQDQRRADRVY